MISAQVQRGFFAYAVVNMYVKAVAWRLYMEIIMTQRPSLAACALLAGFLWTALPAAAGTPDGLDSTMTLDQVVDVALRQNAQLRSRHASWEAKRERVSLEGSLPNPTFQYGGMDVIEGGDWPNTNEKRFGVEQSFPWFGKRGLREKTADQEAQATGLEYDASVRDLVMTVKENYYDLYSLQRSIEITRDERGVLEQMQKIAETKYSTGEVQQQDAVKAQAEVSMLEARILELEQEEAVLKAKLNQLLNRPAQSPLGIAVSAPPQNRSFDVDSLLTLAKQTRPEIKQARLDLERSASQRDLMKKESFPDYRLGAEYRSFREGDDMLMLTLGFDLPIWRNRNRAGVHEAEKLIESEQAGLEEVNQQISYDVMDAHARLVAGERIAKLYETALVPQAQARFEASEAGYGAGKVGFLDLLESERFLLEARILSAMADAKMGVLLARLERAVGTDFGGSVPPHAPGSDHGNGN